MNRLFVISVAVCSVFGFSSCKKTENPVDEKRIFTSPATEITMVSAQLNGSVSSADMIKAGDVGFIISTSPDMKDGIQIMSDGNDGDRAYFAQIANLTVSTTYYYNAILKGGIYYLEGDAMQFTTKPFVFAAVDLGLSVRWANANLGGNAPYESGDYYAWGEIEPKSDYSWSTYKWANGAYNKLTKYCPSGKGDYWDGAGSPDGKTVLDPEDDVAHVKLGGKWRMPTTSEWFELRMKCKWTWTSQGGMRGYRVTGSNGNSIFLPAAGAYGTSLKEVGTLGFYWSSSLITGSPFYVFGVSLNETLPNGNINDRCVGLSVRPVSE